MPVRRPLLLVFCMLIAFSIVNCSGKKDAADPEPTQDNRTATAATATSSPAALPTTGASAAELAGSSLTPAFLIEENGQLSRLSGRIVVSSAKSDDPVDISRALIEENPGAFGLGENGSVTDPEEYESNGLSVVTFQRTLNGVPVFGSAIRTHVSEDGEVLYVANTPAVNSSVPETPEISEAKAASAALESLASGVSGELASSELMVFNQGLLEGSETESYLSYRVDLFTDEPSYLVTFVDAITGDVLYQYDDLQGGLDAEVYSSGNNKDFKALKAPFGEAVLLLTEEGRAAGSPANAEAELALSLIGTVYEYFDRTFNWQSYDGDDSRMTAYIDYSDTRNNAFWNSQFKSMMFMSGLVKLDVFAHEFMHAVTAERSQLVYVNESGALNEAFSDIFAEFVEGNGKWLLGEELTQPESAIAGPLRSLANPPLKNHPWHYDDRYTGNADHGGVHRNSGIINHSAYLLVNGTHDTGGGKKTGFEYTATGKDGQPYEIEINSGIGQTKAEQIYFFAQDYMLPTERFIQARDSIVLACEAMILLGKNEITTRDCGTVINSLAAVGIGPGDRDFDTVVDSQDNCEMDFNPMQHDEDGNGTGDACEPARLANPYRLSPITAVYSGPTDSTTYWVTHTPAPGLVYTWYGPECGERSSLNGRTDVNDPPDVIEDWTWKHLNSECPSPPYHPDTRILLTVGTPIGTYLCEYEGGAASGSGSLCEFTPEPEEYLTDSQRELLQELLR